MGAVTGTLAIAETFGCVTTDFAEEKLAIALATDAGFVATTVIGGMGVAIEVDETPDERI